MGWINLHKEHVKEIIDKMPDNSTFEDIQYAIYVQSKIQRGLNAAERKDVISQETLEKRIEKWLKQ